MRFLTNFSWEFIQNLPLVAGLMFGLWLWQDGRIFPAIASILTGSLLGVAIIRLTEEKIVGSDQAGLQGNREPLSVTAANFALMSIIMLALTLYISANWSSFITDLAVGAVIGVLLSAGQSAAAGRTIGWRHSIAFATAFPAALIVIRLLSTALPVIIAIVLVTSIVTLIITFVDYGHLSPLEEGAN